MKPEYLITSDQHFRGDVIDRGWSISRDEDNRLAVIKLDGMAVQPIRSIRSLMMIPPFSIVHIGYGFRMWDEREVTAAWGVLHGKQAEIREL